METEFISYKKIIIFGSKGVGKTTLIKKMQNNINLEEQISEESNKDINYYKLSIKLDKSKLLNLNLFEIRIDSVYEFIKNPGNLNSLLYLCQYAIFLIDVTSTENFQLLKNIIKLIEKENFNYLNLMILFNKTDLKGLTKITENNIKDFLYLYPYIKYKKISLKKDNIEELLFEMLNDMKKDNIPLNIVLEPRDKKFRYIKNEINLNFIFLGDSYLGGKTTFLNKYKNGNCSEFVLPTIGINKEVYFKMINKNILKISLFDKSGQERFKSLPKKYIQNADGIVLFFDVTCEESFNNINKRLEDIYNNRENKDLIIYLVGNKIDIIDRKISKEVAKLYAESKGMRYFESSAIYNINVKEIIDTMILEAYSKLMKIPFNFISRNKEFFIKIKKYLSF